MLIAEILSVLMVKPAQFEQPQDEMDDQEVGFDKEAEEAAAGIFAESPLKALMRECEGSIRRRFDLTLPSGKTIPLWFRKPGHAAINRLLRAREKRGNQQEASQLSYQLIIKYTDRKIADNGADTDYVAAFSVHDEEALRKISFAVIEEMANEILRMDGFSLSEAKND